MVFVSNICSQNRYLANIKGLFTIVYIFLEVFTLKKPLQTRLDIFNSFILMMAVIGLSFRSYKGDLISFTYSTDYYYYYVM